MIGLGVAGCGNDVAREPSVSEAKALRALGAIQFEEGDLSTDYLFGKGAPGIGWTMRPDGSGVRRLPWARSYPSPDGRHLAVLRLRQGQDQLLVDGQPLVTTRNRLFGLAWSPSGDHLAMLQTGDDSDELVVVSLANGQVSYLGRANTPVTWSPDGARLAHVTPVYSYGRLVTMNPRGREVRVLDEIFSGSWSIFGSIDKEVAWSPDGRTIAYVQDDDDRGLFDTYIALVSASGGKQRALTASGTDASDAVPVWSPDSRWIAFLRSEPHKGDLYLVRANRSGERLVARGGRLPAWSPDGRWLAFVGSGEDIYLTRPERAGELLRLTHDGEPKRSLQWLAAG